MDNSDRYSCGALRLCHVNCQSLVGHLDEFRMFFEAADYDVICMSETWLKPPTSDDFIALHGYKVFRCDRLGKTGGGVGFFIRENFQVRVLGDSGGSYQGKPEYLIAEFSPGYGSKVLLAVVYRPPHLGFLDLFENAFLKLYPMFRNQIICGDFNTDLLNANHDSNHLRRFISSSNLHLVPSEPTHHLQNSSTLIDLCIVDDLDKVTDHGQHEVPFLSAHDLIYITYDLKVVRQAPRIFSCRSLQKINLELFHRDLEEADWSEFFEVRSLDSKVEIFNSLVTDCLDRHAPIRQVSVKNSPAPWLTSDIKEAMTRRDRARRAWKKNRGNSSLHLEFRKLRNQAQKMIKDAKSRHYIDVFRSAGDVRAIWSELRKFGLIPTKRTNTSIDLPLSELNGHFVKMGGEGEGVSVAPYYLGQVEYDDSKFYFKDISVRVLDKALNHSRSNATGVDGIAINVIKLALPSLRTQIHHLFTFSLMQGIFPENWKYSLVTPLPKIKTPTSCGDYRPISILPSLSKALERIVTEQIMEFLDKNGLHDPFQSAYRKGFSTHTALLRLTDDIRKAADIRMVTVAVFFDFSKAFDRVRHDVLLSLLRELNFSNSALRWLCSYLVGRKQAVRDGQENISDWLQVENGVPQGSVLGPLLFSIYVSDLRKRIRYCNHSIFADDTVFYLHCAPAELETGIRQVNEDVASFYAWALEKGLLLNADKTKVMVIGTTRHINTINLISLAPVTVHGQPLQYSTNTKCLGITLTNKLQWHEHTDSTVRKIFGTLHQLRINRRNIPKELRVLLITTLVFPHIDYCCLIYLDLTGELNLLLERALNACVRFIFDLRRDEHITPYYKQLGWLKISDRRKYFLGCMIFNILKTKTPLYLSQYLVFRDRMLSRDTRAQTDHLIVPICRTELFKKSFRSAAPQFWNSLPTEIRNMNSLNSFKAKLFTHLLKLAYTGSCSEAS